jgi:hypothetical protein
LWSPVVVKDAKRRHVERKTTPSDGNFANGAMATARNGRDGLIPLVQRLCFCTRLASGWTVAATEDAADAKRSP